MEENKFSMKIEKSEIKKEDNKLKLNWKYEEIPFNEKMEDYYKRTLAEEDFKKWEFEHQAQRSSETDIADKYITTHAVIYEKIKNVGYTSIYVLDFLNGKPWNNLALNYVHSLRPSAIRVSTGLVTCDCYLWRVTVTLEKDNRTIKYISQEVEVGLYGSHNGRDLNSKLDYFETHGNLDNYKYDDCNIFINTYGVEKINIESGEK